METSQLNFQDFYVDYMLNEARQSIFSTPAMMIATALLLGIVDVNYVAPAVKEIYSKVTKQLHQKTPEQVKQIEVKAAQIQSTPKVQEIANKIDDSWRTYMPPAPPTQPELAHYKDTSEDFYIKARDMIKQDEGKRNSLYKDTKNKWTIGYGHLIKNNDELKQYQDKTLTDEEMDKILDNDIQSKAKLARSLFPEFDTFTEDLKLVLLNGIFRGDVSGSPRTIELINQKNFEQAAKEYLDHEDYKEASKPTANDKGVAIRMLRNAQIIAKQTGK